MTKIINSTALSETKRAELYALPGGFDWIIEDFSDMGRVLDDTHAAYLEHIEALKSEISPDGDPRRVNFHVLDGELWAHTALGREACRAVT